MGRVRICISRVGVPVWGCNSARQPAPRWGGTVAGLVLCLRIRRPVLGSREGTG